MTSKIYKSLSVLIALVTVLSIISCGKINPHERIKDETKSGKDKYTANLPDVKYDGYTFRILERDHSQGWGEKGFFDEETSTVFGESVYRRNNIIESRYGIELDLQEVNDTNIKGGPIYRKAFQSLSTYTDDYDLILPSVYDAITLSGFLLDLSQEEYIDLDADWWSDTLNKSIAIGGKQHFAISDAMFNDKLDSAIILFNDKILNDLNLETPYKYVKSMTWTVDKLSEYIKGYGADVNNDGIAGYEDRYGIFFLEYSGLVVGSGVTGSHMDENGIPVLNPLSSSYERIFDKLFSLVTTPYNAFNMYNYAGKQMDTYSNSSPNEVIDAIWRKFRDGDTMFCACSIECIAYYLNDMNSYGVLPYPLANENQTTYYNRVGHTGATFITIPYTVADHNRSAIIVEDLSCEAKNIICPSFYDKLLGIRSVRDDESVEMLDLIFDHEILDLDLVYEWGAFVVRWHTLLHFGDYEISSAYAGAWDSAQERLENTLTVLGLLD